MTCNEIIKYFESWVPKEIAWQKDNVGLQVGSTERNIKNILLCLEVTNETLDDAIKKDCNLIITHHPLLFHPLKKIDTHKDKNSKLIERIIKYDITLYSAHTNLDFTKDGVSFELAKTLNLKKINFLVQSKSNQYKLIVFSPIDYIDKISSVIFENGGGIIGEYSHCSFRTEGKGTFLGSDKSAPFSGSKGSEEKVNEIKLEVIIDSWKLKKILNAILKVHPYEEVAYDVYPLENSNTNYGQGAVGELETTMKKKEFLKYVSERLNIKNFRYVEGGRDQINKIALCGGAGSELIKEAIDIGADAFITADIKYHAFHDASGEILLIDAGHYETEIHSLNEVKRRLEEFVTATDSGIKVFKYDGTTNPIIFYNN